MVVLSFGVLLGVVGAVGAVGVVGCGSVSVLSEVSSDAFGRAACVPISFKFPSPFPIF